MGSIIQQVTGSPLLIRVVPFVIFVLLTFLQGQFGESSRYWFYLAKTVAGIWFIWLMRPLVAEMKWVISWEGIAVGVLVFGIWVGLDSFYPKFGQAGKPWNPHAEFGAGSALAWMFVLVRLLGSALIVPALEEVFYRSFLYRYIVKPDFQSVPLGHFCKKALLISAIIFGVAHFEWLPAILCALAYQGLVIWKKRLGDAMTAHAVTNGLLGIWVIWKGAWQFW